MPVLFLLTAATGLVDAASFLGLGRIFTANMTGNVVLLAFAAVGTPGLSLARSGAALAAFVAGAVVGGRLGPHLEGPARRRALVGTLAAEAGLVAIAAAGVPHLGAYAAIVPTALAMGMRNAVVRKLAVRDLTTTVLTLTVTGLAADSPVAGGKGAGWRRRGGAVLAMVLGAAAGAWLLRYGVSTVLWASSAVAALSAAWLSFVQRRASGGAGAGRSA